MTQKDVLEALYCWGAVGGPAIHILVSFNLQTHFPYCKGGLSDSKECILTIQYVLHIYIIIHYIIYYIFTMFAGV